MVKTSKAKEILGYIEETFEVLRREVAFVTYNSGPARNRGMLGFVVGQEANQRISQAIGGLYMQLLRWDMIVSKLKLPATNPLQSRVNQIKVDFAKMQREIGYI